MMRLLLFGRIADAMHHLGSAMPATPGLFWVSSWLSAPLRPSEEPYSTLTAPAPGTAPTDSLDADGQVSNVVVVEIGQEASGLDCGPRGWVARSPADH